METYFFEVFGNNFIEAFISSKNPFDILTFMASEAVIYDSMIQNIQAGKYINNQQCQRVEINKIESSEPQDEHLLQNELMCHRKLSIEKELGNSIDLKVQDKIQNKEEPALQVVKLKSSEELSNDFLQNQKILASLSFNIDDLFKKISSLTEEVKSQIGNKPLASAGSLNKIEYSRKKIQVPITHSLNLIPVKQPEPVPIQQHQSKEQSHLVELGSSQINIRMFELGQSLGHGKFGQVLECRHKQTGFVYALKKVFKSTIEDYRMSDQFLIQLESMKRMDHPNVIKIYTAFTDQFHIFIVCEYALGQQLVKKLNSPQQNVRKIILQVLNALKYIHQQGVVHRDLKPQNIIIDELGSIKICDFGWSSLILQNEKMNILCGTLDYVCPEMVLQQTYTKEVDLWSVGVLTYELIFGFAPFKAQSKTATFNKVKKLEYEFPGSYRFSSECLDFINKLLKPETERMRLEQCLTHPFINNSPFEQNINQEFLSVYDNV